MKISAGVEYHGSQYAGWQRQQHSASVQERVEDALAAVADHPVRVTCAGRTDAGVHALGQVIHFETEAARQSHSWVLGANTQLPGDISIIWAQPAAADFHARYSALSRSYRYLILNRPARPGLHHLRVAWECRRLDADRMSRAAAALVGEHDFTSYRAASCQAHTAVRKVTTLDVRRCGEFIIIFIEANAFLHHMVRNIVGVLMSIGLRRQEVGWAQDVLAARDRACGGVTAAPHGLYLAEVKYPAEYAVPVRRTAPLAELQCPAGA